MTSPWLVMSEACAYVRCHENSLRRHIKEGKIRPGKFGKDYRFTVEMLDKYIMNRKGS